VSIVKWSSWCIVGFGVRRYCILVRLSRYSGNMVIGVHPTGRYRDLALLKMVLHEGANKSSRFHYDISLSISQFMPLLPTRKLPKLLLRDPRLKPF
jgi:hypothetical protein